MPKQNISILPTHAHISPISNMGLRTSIHGRNLLSVVCFCLVLNVTYIDRYKIQSKLITVSIVHRIK